MLVSWLPDCEVGFGESGETLRVRKWKAGNSVRGKIGTAEWIGHIAAHHARDSGQPDDRVP